MCAQLMGAKCIQKLVAGLESIYLGEKYFDDLGENLGALCRADEERRRK